MGGKFSHRLVSTLSYLLYTSMPRIFWMWTTSSYKLQLVQVHWIWNSNIVKLWISQQGRNSLFFPPTTTNSSLLPLSRNGDLPLSMNGWHPRSLVLPCSLSRAGILALSCWHPPSLNEWLPSILFWQTASFHLWQWPRPSLGRWASLPQQTASPLLWRAASPLPQQTVPSLGGWPHPSLNKLSPSSLSE